LAALKPRVSGKGNGSRFAYWLASFATLREMAHLECLWAEYNAALETVRKRPGEKARAEEAAQTLLPIREKMAAGLKDLYGFLLATVSNTGELGTVANWEQHLLPALVDKPDEELRKLLGTEIPSTALLPKNYDGPPRVVVPTVRTALVPGETLQLKVLILAREKPAEATLHWREMAKGEYAAAPLDNVARGVYRVTCPETEKDLEYYVSVRVAGEEVFFPPTAPLMGQTVVRLR
jgi:hypothetical protein